MKRLLVFLLCLALMGIGVPAHACLNEVSTFLKDGSVIYEDHGDSDYWPLPHRFSDKATLLKALRSLDAKYRGTKDVDYLSDKGYVLIVLGRYREAIDLYRTIEKLSPDRYATASNIGTAYELAGDNAQALHWIEKAYRLNDGSHAGSEWIHVNILKAKLGGGPVDSKALLNVDFGSRSKPEYSWRTLRPAKKLRAQLVTQLRERISFVKPKDPIVAQLFFDLGNLDLVTDPETGYWYAEGSYLKAAEYGYGGPLLAKRQKWVAELETALSSGTQAKPPEDAPFKERYGYFRTHLSDRDVSAIRWIGGISLAALLAMMWLGWKWVKKRRRAP